MILKDKRAKKLEDEFEAFKSSMEFTLKSIKKAETLSGETPYKKYKTKTLNTIQSARTLTEESAPSEVDSLLKKV